MSLKKAREKVENAESQKILGVVVLPEVNLMTPRVRAKGRELDLLPKPLVEIVVVLRVVETMLNDRWDLNLVEDYKMASMFRTRRELNP